MCGICGWLDWGGRAEVGVVSSMAERLAHRGPDGQRLWRDPRGLAVLAHRRLRVLDTSERADQPMVDASGSVLSYNGEVYNFATLRADLEAEGRAFVSSGDTEVVLAALAERGARALDDFNGMFAIAMWDPGADRLLLARDRIGIKPLFWAPLSRGLVFASELPALLAHPGVARDLDGERLSIWLQSGFLAGEHTLVKGVLRLPPGWLLEADAKGVRTRQWYDLRGRSVVAGKMHAMEAAEELEPVIRDAVRSRLVSDVPLGCFLSGGVDSTLVASAARSEGGRPETLTVRFAGGTDESHYAAGSSAALGLEHRVVDCTAERMLDVITQWPRIAADPICDPSLAPTWQISRAARERWTVALAGDGGDELLSGYPRLRFMPRLETAPRAARALLKTALPLAAGRRWAGKLEAALAADTTWGAYQALQGVWPARDANALVGQEHCGLPWSAGLLQSLEGEPPWRRYRLLDLLGFLPERMLAKVDRASMSQSLEVRVPLLDHRVVELVLSMPDALGAGKGILRRVISRLGGPPPARRKKGFEVPLAAWMRGPLKAATEEDLFGVTSNNLGLDHKLLRATWHAHQDGRADYGERLFAVSVLVKWVQEWL